MNERPLYFVTVVWGQIFVEQYLAAALPSWLSDGNFGASRGKPYDRYFLYTTAQDAEVIKAHPAFERLNSLIKTEIRLFEDPKITSRDDTVGSYDANKLANRFYGRTIPESIEAKAALIMLTPDHVWSDGSFANMRKILDSGKKVISLNSILVLPDGFIHALKQNCFNPATHTITAPGRALVYFAATNMHQYTLCQNAGASFYTNFSPSSFWWHVEGEGVVFHIIGGDPKAVVHTDPTIPWPEVAGFEQLEHVHSLGITEDDVYWVQESDEMVCVALDYHKPGDKDLKLDHRTLYQAPSILRAASWIRTHVSKIKQGYLKKVMRLHYGEMTERWQKAEEYAAKFLGEIFESIKFLDDHPDVAADLETQFKFIDSLRDEQLVMQETIKKFYEAVGNISEQFIIHERLAHDYGMKGDHDRALSHIKEMLRMDPQRTAVSVNRTLDLLRVVNRPGEAQGLFEKCSALINNSK